MGERVNDQCLDVILRNARTQNGFLPKPVTDQQLREIYDVVKLGPTSANSSPARFVFVRTKEGKARLLPALSAGNQEKTKQAPVTVIVGYDPKFWELLPTKLFTHRPEMKDPYEKSAELAETVSFRNGSLQGAYFMIAARALGLDVGGMSGFDNKKVDAEFFPDGRVKSNFLINVGYGDPAKVMPKLPRLTFEEACTLL
jgi:3-hydroxypropanoate dehydrogenase